MKKTMRWCVVLAVLTVSGCKSPPAPNEAREGVNLYGTKSCVEFDRPGYDIERNCFASKADFQSWRTCVDRGGTAVECYTGSRASLSVPIPQAVLPQPSANEHFRFSYVILNETAVRAAAINDYDRLKRLVFGQPVCNFVGDIAGTSREELTLDTIGTLYKLTLVDVKGDSAGCAAGNVKKVQITFLGIPNGVGIQRRGLFDSDISQTVQTADLRNFRPYFETTSSNGATVPEVFFAYFDHLSAPAPNAVVTGAEVSGSFAFVAKSDGSDQMIVVFDGSLRMKNRK